MHDSRWYAGAVRAAVWLLLMLLILPAHGRAEDEEDENASGVARRLRAIDEAAEYELDHPEAAGEEPVEEEEEPDPTATEHEDEPAEAVAPARRAGASAREKTKAPSQKGAAQKAPGSPLEGSADVDDDR